MTVSWVRYERSDGGPNTILIIQWSNLCWVEKYTCLEFVREFYPNTILNRYFRGHFCNVHLFPLLISIFTNKNPIKQNLRWTIKWKRLIVSTTCRCYFHVSGISKKSNVFGSYLDQIYSTFYLYLRLEGVYFFF